MPVNGFHSQAHVADIYADGLMWLGAEPDWLDVHTHIGENDPDGYRAEPREILEALDYAGQRQALLFAMHEPGGYRDANDRVLDACAASGGRLMALGRVDPNVPGALAEAERCLRRGARGIKLHPRSEAFAMDHAAIEPIVALCAAGRHVVLFHAGRGIPALGASAVDLARAYPDARIVLAHAGISDLELLAEPAAELPNLLFDTSWWQPGDLLTLYATIPPGRILYASDMPYGPPMVSGSALLRCARAVGLAPDVVSEIAGPQARRALNGEDLLDLGPAPGAGALGARDLAYERVVAYLTSAVQAIFRGGDPGEALALARLACRAPVDVHGTVLREVDRRISAAQAEIESAGSPTAGVVPAMGAILVAGTPTVGPTPAL